MLSEAFALRARQLGPGLHIARMDKLCDSDNLVDIDEIRGGTAHEGGLNTAGGRLRCAKRADPPLKATTASVGFAVTEKGLKFKPDASGSTHRLIADVFNAQHPGAWPMVGYTYTVLRKATMREADSSLDDGSCAYDATAPNFLRCKGAKTSCANRRETVRFWHWFYHSELVKQLAGMWGKLHMR